MCFYCLLTLPFSLGIISKNKKTPHLLEILLSEVYLSIWTLLPVLKLSLFHILKYVKSYAVWFYLLLLITLSCISTPNSMISHLGDFKIAYYTLFCFCYCWFLLPTLGFLGFLLEIHILFIWWRPTAMFGPKHAWPHLICFSSALSIRTSDHLFHVLTIFMDSRFSSVHH